MPDVRVEERQAVATAVIVVAEASMWREALDEIWAFMRAEGLPAGRNVMRYGARVEIGVELAGFVGTDRIVASSLPAGPSAVAVHRGSPVSIGATHDAVRSWCTERGVELTGECWEIYGHWRDDEASFETLVGWPLAGPRAGLGTPRFHGRSRASPARETDPSSLLRSSEPGTRPCGRAANPR